jgi:uncharacterized membrane protein YfcA
MFLMDSTLLAVIGIVFIATPVRSTFGFGEALVSVPLLCFYVPVRTAVPLATLLSVVIAALILIQDWRNVRARSAAWLIREQPRSIRSTRRRGNSDEELFVPTSGAFRPDR